MKTWKFIMLAMIACNQVVYDQVYREIIINLAHKPSRENMELRNQAIENLRALCNGQKSSYERGAK